MPLVNANPDSKRNIMISTKSKIKILFRESFFPYLLMIVALLVALLIIDRKMENQDNLVVIDLNREEAVSDDQLGIQQKINLANMSWASAPRQVQAIEEINKLIDQRQWKSAITHIENLADARIKNDAEAVVTLGFLYHKTGRYKKGIEILQVAADQNNSLKNDPRYFYTMGLLYGKGRNYQAAIGYFEKYLESKKLSYEAFMNIGHLYYKMGRYDQSLVYFTKSGELSNMDRRARALYWAALAQVKLNKPEKALESLNLAIHNDPGLAGARVQRAKLLIDSKPEESLEDLKKVIQAYPEYLETYHVIAEYYAQSGENEKGLYWLKKGLDNAPNSTKTKSGVGIIYLKLKEYEKARQIFSELLEQFPKSEVYYFSLARSYSGLGDYAKAIEAYHKALVYRPGYYEVFINLGIAYAKSNNPEKALFYYNKAIETNATDASVYFNMGILYSKLDQRPAALKAYQQAIQLQADYPEAYFNMGIVYNRQGNFENARGSYLKAIEYRKDYVNAYYNLANLYDAHGERDKATDLLGEGIGMTDDLKLMNKLAELHETSGDIKNARNLYEKILEKDSENTDALLNLSRLFLTQKNFEESKKFIERYLSANPKSSEGRYVLMVDAYNLGKYEMALNQYEILARISPNYKDMAGYKDKIKSKI